MSDNKSIALTMEEVCSLAKKYAIPVTDVLLIALNRYGIHAEVPDNRLRFKLKLLTCKGAFYVAVCVNTFLSPFTLHHNKLYLGSEVIGIVFDIEKDTCDSTYFRRNRTELTLNSNMRSRCFGCTFCGTYKLDADDGFDMSCDEKIYEYIEQFMKNNGMANLENLVRLTICTGCFASEERLIEHILSVYRVFQQFGFNKRIRYIGSQIRSEKAMRILSEQIRSFSLSLTVECFTNRERRMRKEKASLSIEEIKEVLARALRYNFSTNYLYIVGLDELEDMKSGIQNLSNKVNRLPVFQIMQNYVSDHEKERVEAAKNIEYYLQARQIIEDCFKTNNYTPRIWENYRGLFYTQYQNKPLPGIRI